MNTRAALLISFAFVGSLSALPACSSSDDVLPPLPAPKGGAGGAAGAGGGAGAGYGGSAAAGASSDAAGTTGEAGDGGARD